MAIGRKLRKVAADRRPFLALEAQILAGLVERFPPSEKGPIVEIGSGDGQLREWMADDVRLRTVHTEPLGLLLRQFRKRWPEADARKASAERLPFADGEVAAVLGSCVLDIVDDGNAIAAEIARILRPGGYLIHLLDLSTELDDAFETLHEAGLIPVPNVFADPCAVRWPEDVFLIGNQSLHRVADVLERGTHSFARPLRRYLSVFESRPFAAKLAVAEYAQLAESIELRQELRGMFRDAGELADPIERVELATFRGQPAASSRYFESRLRRWFGANGAYQVVFSDIVAASMQVLKEPEWPFDYHSLCAGELRKLTALPAALLHPGPRVAKEGQTLRELGVFVFVARRV